MTTAIYAVAISLVIFVSLVLMTAVGFGAYRIYKALKSVADGLASLNDNMVGVPAILEGVKNVCVELSTYTVNVGGSVEKLRTSLFSSQTSEPRREAAAKDTFKEYSDEDAGREYNIKNLMQSHNLSYQQARDMTVAGIDEGRFFVGDE